MNVSTNSGMRGSITAAIAVLLSALLLAGFLACPGQALAKGVSKSIQRAVSLDEGLNVYERGCFVESLGKVVTVYKRSGHQVVYFNTWDGLFKSVKSSNTKVATVKVLNKTSYDDEYASFRVRLKKAGTTKITYKLNGKKKSFTLKVRKYKSPVKSLKVGDVNYASMYDSAPAHAISRSSLGRSSNALKVKAKAGWTVQGVYLEELDGLKPVKNGGKVRSSGGQYVMSFKNKKSGVVKYAYLHI